MAALLALFLSGTFTTQAQGESGIYVNKRPMKDWSEKFTKAIDSKEIDLNSPFLISIVAILGTAADGKTIVLKSPQKLAVSQAANSDPKLIALVEDAVLALGDAGWFGYLSQLNSRRSATPVKIGVRQDEINFAVAVDVGMQSDNEAKTMSSGLTTLFSLAASQVKDEDKPLLRSMTVSATGKSVRISSTMPKAEFWELVRQQTVSIAPGKSDN